MSKENELYEKIVQLEAENAKLKKENNVLLDDLSKVQSDCLNCEHKVINKFVKPSELEELEKWRDAFGGRTPEEAKKDFDGVIQDLIDCKAGKRKEAIEILANRIADINKKVDVRKLVKPLQWSKKRQRYEFILPLSQTINIEFYIHKGVDKYTGLSKILKSSIFDDTALSIEEIIVHSNLNRVIRATNEAIVSLVANACGIEVRK